MTGVLEAKSELFHLCMEVEETGEAPPTLENVLALIFEEVINESTSTTGSDSQETRRRVLRSTDRSDVPHRRALRADHLPHNRYTRPRRLLTNGRRLEEEGSSAASDLVDAISVTGGQDDKQFFIRFQIDVSRMNIESLDELIQKPLELLSEVDFLANMLPDPGSADSPISMEANVSLAASLHASILVGFEINATEINEFLFGVRNISASELASRAFVQFEDVSAKAEVGASLSGSLDLLDVATLGVEDGSIGESIAAWKPDIDAIRTILIIHPDIFSIGVCSWIG